MGSVITVRNIDPGDKSWLEREACRHRISMEEFVRRLIHEKREKTEQRDTPSEVFRRYFRPEHGVDLPLPKQYGCRPVVLLEAPSPVPLLP